MLSVDDIFSSDIGHRHEEEEVVSGFLVVSKHLTYLCPSSESRQRAILVVAPGLIEQWMPIIPAYGGSMVTFAGEAIVKGRIAKSGLDPCPYAFYDVARIDFRNTHGMEALYEAINS
jgi:hypothetical protein